MKTLDFALGLIETRGLIGAIEAADAATKAADVKLVSREKIRGGFVTIKVIGDVAAVRAAVDAGGAAAARVGELISTHIIPRPIYELNSLIFTTDKIPIITTTKKIKITEKSVSENKRRGRKPQEIAAKSKETPKEIVENKTTIPITNSATTESESDFLKSLEAMTVHELRRLARSTEGLSIFGRQISMANKDVLISEIMKTKFPK